MSAPTEDDVAPAPPMRSRGAQTARLVRARREPVSGPDRPVSGRACHHLGRIEPAGRTRLRPHRPEDQRGASDQRPAHRARPRRVPGRDDAGVRLVPAARHGAGDGDWRRRRRAIRPRRRGVARRPVGRVAAPAHAAGGGRRARRPSDGRRRDHHRGAARRGAVLRGRAPSAGGNPRGVRADGRRDVRQFPSLRARSHRGRVLGDRRAHHRARPTG